MFRNSWHCTFLHTTLYSDTVFWQNYNFWVEPSSSYQKMYDGEKGCEQEIACGFEPTLSVTSLVSLASDVMSAANMVRTLCWTRVTGSARAANIFANPTFSMTLWNTVTLCLVSRHNACKKRTFQPLYNVDRIGWSIEAGSTERAVILTASTVAWLKTYHNRRPTSTTASFYKNPSVKPRGKRKTS